jgi:hypothetical protein
MRALLLTGLLALALASTAAAQALTAEGAEPGQKIQIRDLTRDASGALTLRFLLINDSCCGVSGVMLREKGSDAGNKASGVTLTDEAGNQYKPARGPDGQCLCSIMPNTGKGERANIWVKFAPLSPEARKVTVEVKTFEPISDVPITGP